MQEFITDMSEWYVNWFVHLIWLTITIVGAFAIVYSLVRLAAIAWHRTKREYDLRHFSEGDAAHRNHQNGKEL